MGETFDSRFARARAREKKRMKTPFFSPPTRDDVDPSLPLPPETGRDGPLGNHRVASRERSAPDGVRSCVARRARDRLDRAEGVRTKKRQRDRPAARTLVLVDHLQSVSGGAPRSHGLVHRSREQQVVPIARLAPCHGPRAVVVCVHLVRQRRELHRGDKRASARAVPRSLRGEECFRFAPHPRAKFFSGRRADQHTSREVASRPKENEVTTKRGDRAEVDASRARASRGIDADATDAVTEPLRASTAATPRRESGASRGRELSRARVRRRVVASERSPFARRDARRCLSTVAGGMDPRAPAGFSGRAEDARERRTDTKRHEDVSCNLEYHGAERVWVSTTG